MRNVAQFSKLFLYCTILENCATTILIQHSETNRFVDVFDFFDKLVRIALANIHNYVADGFVGFQVLTNNIDVMFRKNIIDFGQNTWYVLVNMQQTVRITK